MTLAVGGEVAVLPPTSWQKIKWNYDHGGYRHSHPPLLHSDRQGGDDCWAGDLGLQPGGRHKTAAGITTRLTAMDFMGLGTAMKSMAVSTISAREFLPWH
ncbi:hypothetical protein NDU88_005940 [Pleurodeles waltl]|uniref:Uncharacterized protein n=1 Tax=Pleurodeles waltl TaxID=8319 RepID=A0AAV7NNV8_PLEWA|nr:hypothetical protein NDU88_005940 [Pleurodeles waltl]